MKNFIRIAFLAGIVIVAALFYALLHPSYTNKPKYSQVAYLAALADIRPLQEKIEANIKKGGIAKGAGIGVPSNQPPGPGSQTSWMAVMEDGEIIVKVPPPANDIGSESNIYILFIPMVHMNNEIQWKCITFPEGAVSGVCKKD